MYAKILFVDYNETIAVIELIGEWNDLLHNDIMFLKRELIDKLVFQGIHKFILLCDNVLNFHGDDDSYYEEWWEDVKEEGGWIAFLNLRDHIVNEMQRISAQYYVNFGENFNEINWQLFLPKVLIKNVESQIYNQTKQLDY